ncbi:MAG TPA: TonB-dependent receptor [Longimicrobium sp.]|jgi:outer membrane receptor for ferrienterochelin and colicin
MIKRCSQTAAALLCAMLLAFGWTGGAQAQGVTTSAVSGRVTNAAGAPVAGARVLVTSGSTGAQSRVVTREDGRYLVTGLQPGSGYRVEVSGLGLAPQTRTGVTLTLSQTLRLDFSLAAQAIAIEGITARAERSGATFSRTRTGPATTVRDSALQRLPTISRDLSDFTRLVPQIATSGGGSNAAGRNSRFNNIQIDGAVNNDLFGLSASGTPGGSAGTRPITMEAIQELQVVLAPFDVRQGGFTGAGINAVTKSGTNRFSGSASFFTRDQELVGRYRFRQADSIALSPEYSNFNETNFGASLGGPIIRNKVHFFVAGERTDRESPTGFVAGQQSSISDPLATRISQILTTQYGYDPGTVGEVKLGRESTNIFGRLDFNLSPNQRLTIRNNYVDAFDDNLARRNDLYQLGNTLYKFDSKTNSTVAQLNSTFGSNLSNELRVNRTTIRERRNPGTVQLPFVRVGAGGTNFVVAGPENSSVANALNQDLIEVTNDLTLSAGAHRITLGTHNEFFEFSNLFAQNIYGNYRFADTTALKAGTPNQYSYTFLNPANPNARERAEFKVRQLSAYLQDQWEAQDNLTITAGLRLDRTSFPDKPAQNDSVAKYYQRNTGTVGGEDMQFSPRLGFNWDLTGDQVTQVRGGVGLFSGRTPYVWVSNAFGNTGLDYVRFTCNTPSVPAFVTDPTKQPTACTGATSFTPNEINTLSPNFKLPQVFRASFGVDRRLPRDFVVTFEGLFNQSLSDPVYRNLAIRTDSLTGPVATGGYVEGRPRFSRRYPNGSFPATSGLARLGEVYEVYNTDENYTYSLTGQLQKTFSRTLDVRLAYTYTDSKDVNPLRSSTASSNFVFNLADANPNDPNLRPSDWLVKHRILASGTYSANFIRRAPTEISFIYEGESGRPYSYRYDGDVNNDNATSNDLIYIPRSIGEVRFQAASATQPLTPEQSWANLNAFINRVECLRESRGKVLQRNACNQPWSNRFDVRLAQTVPSVGKQNVQLTLDVLNFGNLLNRSWGFNESVANQSDPLLRVTNNTPNANGRVELAPFAAGRQVFQPSNLGSRYQIQLGARYLF